MAWQNPRLASLCLSNRDKKAPQYSRACLSTPACTRTPWGPVWPHMSASWTLIPTDSTLTQVATEDRNLLINKHWYSICSINYSPMPFRSSMAVLACQATGDYNWKIILTQEPLCDFCCPTARHWCLGVRAPGMLSKAPQPRWSLLAESYSHSLGT